jgi:hypothetical protein
VAKLIQWSTKEVQKKELGLRLRFAKEQRKNLVETAWDTNERTVYNTRGGNSIAVGEVSADPTTMLAGGPNQSDSEIGTNYSFKNLRFIHAQLSANPPSVVPRPTSSDPEDKRRADAADRLVKYGLRQYKMQEKADLASLNCILYGTGFIKTMWDSEAGDIIGVDEEGNVDCEGDFSITVPNTRDIFLDPDATCFEDVRFVFERIYMPYEQACYLYPEAKEILEQYRLKEGRDSNAPDQSISSSLQHKYYDSVELYQYWEKGLPVNAYLGRFCVCTKDGEPLTPMMENPEKYAAPSVKTGKKQIAKAVLPFHIFTDVDVPNQIYGKSFIEFGTNLQDNLNRLDSVLLETIQSHGIPRLVLPEGAEIADGSITNSPWDIVKMTGTQPPHFMEAMPLPAGMTELRGMIKNGIDDMGGVNESMFGQQSREQSGFSMQYATNQGNMIRRRLFNKYVLFIESVYKRYLQIIQKNWTTPRTILVLGKEKAFEAMDIRGADIDSGYDLVVEYGTSFSLDPTTRREEVLTLAPFMKEAGIKPREILGLLKLNDIAGAYDRAELAEDRQREIFEEMIASGLYIKPREMADHQFMLDYAYYYIMTTEFKYLSDEDKNLIEQHIKEREAIAASQAAAAAPQPMPPAGPLNMPMPGAPVS